MSGVTECTAAMDQQLLEMMMRLHAAQQRQQSMEEATKSELINKKYGLRIRYPSSWSLQPNNSINEIATFQIPVPGLGMPPNVSLSAIPKVKPEMWVRRSLDRMQSDLPAGSLNIEEELGFDESFVFLGKSMYRYCASVRRVPSVTIWEGMAVKDDVGFMCTVTCLKDLADQVLGRVREVLKSVEQSEDLVMRLNYSSDVKLFSHGIQISSPQGWELSTAERSLLSFQHKKCNMSFFEHKVTSVLTSREDFEEVLPTLVKEAAPHCVMKREYVRDSDIEGPLADSQWLTFPLSLKEKDEDPLSHLPRTQWDGNIVFFQQDTTYSLQIQDVSVTDMSISGEHCAFGENQRIVGSITADGSDKMLFHVRLSDRETTLKGTLDMRAGTLQGQVFQRQESEEGPTLEECGTFSLACPAVNSDFSGEGDELNHHAWALNALDSVFLVVLSGPEASFPDAVPAVTEFIGTLDLLEPFDRDSVPPPTLKMASSTDHSLITYHMDMSGSRTSVQVPLSWRLANGNDGFRWSPVSLMSTFLELTMHVRSSSDPWKATMEKRKAALVGRGAEIKNELVSDGPLGRFCDFSYVLARPLGAIQLGRVKIACTTSKRDFVLTFQTIGRPDLLDLLSDTSFANFSVMVPPDTESPATPMSPVGGNEGTSFSRGGSGGDAASEEGIQLQCPQS